MRDDFSRPVKEELAKRVGYRCSNRDCRRQTVGPQAQEAGAASIGVAAHITAAAPGGPRFDTSLSLEQRASAANGIWLCQTCARLVDADEYGFAPEQLRDWKDLAEATAAIELRGLRVVPDQTGVLARLEADLPELFAEMREDLKGLPHCREFVLLHERSSYNGSPYDPILSYGINKHHNLRQKVRILENYGFVTNITHNNVPRFSMSEEFVEYLKD